MSNIFETPSYRKVFDWTEFVKYDTYCSVTLVKEELSREEELQLKKVQIKVSYALQKISGRYKFFAEILYRIDLIYTKLITTAATDGSRIFVNPDFFEPMTDAEVLFVFLHEVMHIALLHSTRMQGRDPDRWNTAGDYEINILLVQDGILTAEQVANPDGLSGLINMAYAGKNAEQLYEDPNMKTVEQPKNTNGPGQQGQGRPGQGQPGQGQSGQGQPGQGSGGGEGKGEGEGDEGGAPVTVDRIKGQVGGNEEKGKIVGPKTGQVISKEEGKAICRAEGIESKDKSDDDIKNLARNAAQTHLNPRNKNMGKGSGNIYQRIQELTEPKVNWRQELRKYIGRLEMDSQFKMPNRRHVSSGEYRYNLQDTDNALENAVVALDVSGSVVASFPEFAAEIVGIVKAKKIKIVDVLPFADKVVTPFRVKGFKKPTVEDFAQVKTGGGTEAIPDVINWVNTNLKGKIDFCVIVTDGFLTGGLPPAPPKWGKKCIWLVFDHREFEVPRDWGYVIHANGDPGYWK